MSGVSGLLVTVLRASSPHSVCVPRLVHFHQHNSIIINIALITILVRRGIKNGYFTVRLTVKEGGFSPLGPDRKQM